MSTTRLFDQDAYLGEFEATVERSVCEGGMYRVLLDQTAFFPEGGGQPADEGTLDGIFVTDVQESTAKSGIPWKHRSSRAKR